MKKKLRRNFQKKNKSKLTKKVLIKSKSEQKQQVLKVNTNFIDLFINEFIVCPIKKHSKTKSCIEDNTILDCKNFQALNLLLSKSKMYTQKSNQIMIYIKEYQKLILEAKYYADELARQKALNQSILHVKCLQKKRSLHKRKLSLKYSTQNIKVLEQQSFQNQQQAKLLLKQIHQKNQNLINQKNQTNELQKKAKEENNIVSDQFIQQQRLFLKELDIKNQEILKSFYVQILSRSSLYYNLKKLQNKLLKIFCLSNYNNKDIDVFKVCQKITINNRKIHLNINDKKYKYCYDFMIQDDDQNLMINLFNSITFFVRNCYMKNFKDFSQQSCNFKFENGMINLIKKFDLKTNRQITKLFTIIFVIKNKIFVSQFLNYLIKHIKNDLLHSKQFSDSIQLNIKIKLNEQDLSCIKDFDFNVNQDYQITFCFYQEFHEQKIYFFRFNFKIIDNSNLNLHNISSFKFKDIIIHEENKLNSIDNIEEVQDSKKMFDFVEKFSQLIIKPQQNQKNQQNFIINVQQEIIKILYQKNRQKTKNIYQYINNI